MRELRIVVDNEIYERLRKGEEELKFKIGKETHNIKLKAQYSYYFMSDLEKEK